jgi:hypothetical protein
MTTTLSAAREAFGIRPLTLVEIDLDWILDDVSAVNPDGTLCYRTPATTQRAPDALPTVGSRTRRFCLTTAPRVWDLDAIPCVADVRVEAATLRIGESLGSFGQVTVTCVDFSDDDRQEDPFRAERIHDPAQGTYFTKLAARNPYLQGRSLRVLTGYADPAGGPPVLETRHFLIRSLTRTDRTTWQVVGVSPLQLANLGRAQAPRSLPWQLQHPLPAGASTATLDAALVAADDPTAGLCRIGDELLEFTRNGTALALGRGRYGTIPADAEAGEAVQPALVISDATVPEVLRRLLVDHAGVDPAMIPFADWTAEAGRWLDQYRLSPLPISEPVDIIALINELCQQVGCLLWYDERTRTIRFQVLRPVPTSAVVQLSDDDLLSEVEITTEPSERISQAVVFFARRSALGSGANAPDYRRRLLGLSQGAGPLEFARPATRTILSRWFSASDDALAARTAATLVAQRRLGRTALAFQVSRRHGDLDLGSVIRLTTKDLVDVTGAPQPTFAIIIKRTPTRDGVGLDLVAEPFPFVTRYAYAMPNDHLATYAATPEQARDPAWFLSRPDGRMPGGDPGYALG